MKIIPTRTHRLGGTRVEAGKPVDVPDDDAALSLRHGWAVKAPAAGKAKADKPAEKPADSTAEQE